MKKTISNLLLVVTTFVIGYLLLANINHIIYLNQSEIFDFNGNLIITLNDNFDKLKTNIEKINNLETTIFKSSEISAIKNIVGEIPTKIEKSSIFSYEGTQKIYLKDVYKMDQTTTTFALDNISLVELLIEHDESYQEYKNMLITNFLNDSFNGNENYLEPIEAYQYQNIDFFSYHQLGKMDTRVSSRIYILDNTIVNLNYTLNLILDMAGENNE